MTAQYLLKRTYPVKAGQTILWHAAAGGVGLIACQWAKALGLQLIGTAGSDEKCALAREHGAAFTINYQREDFVARVKEITGGKGLAFELASDFDFEIGQRCDDLDGSGDLTKREVTGIGGGPISAHRIDDRDAFSLLIDTMKKVTRACPAGERAASIYDGGEDEGAFSAEGWGYKITSIEELQIESGIFFELD
jgi:hypothetical protein